MLICLAHHSLEFLKSNDNGHANFYSAHEARQFFEKLKGKIATLISSGIGTAYPDKLRHYGMEFQSNSEYLKTFLHSSEHQLLYISTECTRLSAIKLLFQLEMQLNALKEHDTYIFMCLRTLLYPKTQEYVLNAFRSDSNKYFVIDCQSNDKHCVEEVTKLYERITDILSENNQNKKLILIASNEDADKNNCKEILSERNSLVDYKDKFCYDELSVSSKEKVLAKPIHFQGEEMTVDQIVHKKIANAIFDQEILSKLIEGKIFSVEDSKAFYSNSHLSYVKDIYIDRQFEDSTNTISSEEELSFALNDSPKKVIILANDPGAGKSTTLTGIARKMKVSGQNRHRIWIERINLNDYADKDHPFGLHTINFKENDKDKAIRFLSNWINLQASNDALNIKLQSNLLEASLQNSGNMNLVIMFDGFDEICPDYESNVTVLIKALLATELTQIWVTSRVHKKDHLENQLNASAYTLQPLTDLEQKLFLDKYWKWQFKHQHDGQMLKYNNIIDNLKELKLSEEPYTESLIENLVDILNEYPLEEVHREHELISAIDAIDFNAYSEELLNRMHESFADVNKEFTSVVLHLEMLAVIVFNMNFKMPQEFGMLYSFDEFVKHKLDQIFPQKTKEKMGNQAEKGQSRSYIKDVKRVHTELAVKLILPDEYEMESLPDLKEIKRFIEDKDSDEEDSEELEEKLARIGLLSLKGNQVQFLHRTFAEYFLSKYYLLKRLDEESIQIILFKKILLENDYQ